MIIAHKESLDNFYTLNAPMVYFVCNAKRYSKFRIFIRGIPHNPLWRNVVNSSFLQMLNSKEIIARASSMFFPQSRLPYIRIIPLLDVRNHHGTATHQQDGDSSIQWLLSSDAWPATIPRKVYASSISQAPADSGYSAICSAPRQPQKSSVCSSIPSPQFDFRSGLHRHRYLRRATEGGRRLQSKETRSTLVSSLAVLRGMLSGVLAWQPSPRQYCRCNRCYTVHQDMFGEGTIHNRKKSNTVPHGFRLLFSAYHQLSGCCRLLLRHCRKRIQTDQTTGMRLHISANGWRMGSGGVSGENSSSRQRRAPLCCRQKANTFGQRRCRAVDIVQTPEIRLSCIRHQSAAQSLARVPFLQSSSDNRKKYPRTHVRLSTWQNTNQRMDCECSVFPDGSVRSQHRALVQKAMLTHGISSRDTGDNSRRFPRTSCQISKFPWQKHRQTTQRLPLPKVVPSGISENKVFTYTTEYSNLQKGRSPPLSEKHLKLTVFTLF